MNKFFIILFLLSFSSLAQETVNERGLRSSYDNVYSTSILDEAIPLYNKATIAAGNGDYFSAISDYKKVIKIDPNFTDTYDNIAVCYRRIKRPDMAIFYYKKSLEIFPKNRLVLNNMGLAYSDNKQYSEAINSYQNVLKMSSFSYESNEAGKIFEAEPLFGLARIYLFLGDENRALLNAEKAYEIWIENGLTQYAGDALYIKGLAERNMGNSIKGAELIKRAANLGSSNAKDFIKNR